MKRLHGQSGVISILELVLAGSLAVFLLTWIAYPIRTSYSSQNLISLEMQQRQMSQQLDPLVEDIRESQLVAIRWSYLDPTNTGNYNPVNFPWLWVPSQTSAGTMNFVCYYFDPNAGTLWRLQTNTQPTDPVNCSPTSTGVSATTVKTSVATNLIAPTAAQPIFSGDQVNKTIYITLRVQTGSPGVGAGTLPPNIAVSRMATPRN